MRAIELMYHFQEIGTWVNWNQGNDYIMHGDPDREIKAIGTLWIPTNRAIEAAAAKGINVLVSHEKCFMVRYEGHRTADELNQAKRDLFDRHEMTVIRCHDTWDRMPTYGIPDAWAAFLGFETEERPVESFYKICLLGSMTAEEAARKVLEKVRPLGQETVMVFGDPSRTVTRMAVGTGAITNVPVMREMGADIILATDDGTTSPNSGLYALDGDVPVLVVNHATAELPGMMAMAGYLEKQFDIRTEYMDIEFPYTVVSTEHDSV